MDMHYLRRDLQFVWDSAKAIENRRKHGIRFEDACEAFFDESSVYIDATEDDEMRSAVIGRVEMARILYVVHVVRERETIRIISARSVTKMEESIYEDG
jgi:uncharacterized DUF497 family protein